MGNWLFKSKLGSEVLMATAGSAIRPPRSVIFAVDQKLGWTDYAGVFIRPAPRFAKYLLFLSEVGNRLGNFDLFPSSVGFTQWLLFDQDFAECECASSTPPRATKRQVAMRQGIETQAGDSGQMCCAENDKIPTLRTKSKCYHRVIGKNLRMRQASNKIGVDGLEDLPCVRRFFGFILPRRETIRPVWLLALKLGLEF